MRSTQEKDIFRRHAIKATQEVATKQWELFKREWEVVNKKQTDKLSGVGKQEATTPVEIIIDLIKGLDMRGKDTLIFSNYDLFITIKFLRKKSHMLPYLGLLEKNVNYKTITLLTDSKELNVEPANVTGIEPNELVYVDNLFDIATIEKALDDHTR